MDLRFRLFSAYITDFAVFNILTKLNQEVKAIDRKPRLRRRPFILAITFFAIFLAVVGSVFGVGVYIYKNRVYFVNRHLSTLSKNYLATIDHLEFSERGRVQISNFRVKARDALDKPDLFHSPSVELTYNLGDLSANRKLDSILVKEPRLYIDEGTFQRGEVDPRSGKGKNVDLQALANFTGSFTIEEGDLYVDLPSSPPVRSKWSFKSGQLGFGRDGLTDYPFLSELRDLEIGDQGVFGRIDQVRAEWKFNKNLSKWKVLSLIMLRPVVTVMPEWLPSILPGEDKPSSKISMPEMEVSLDQLVLNNLDLKILGFDGKDRRALIPDIVFQSDLVDWHNLNYKNRRFGSQGALSLEMKDLSIGGGRANLMVSEKVLFATESLGALLHEGHLKSARAENAKFLVSDDSLALWREGGERSAKGESKPFRVDELELPDAEYVMDDFFSIQTKKLFPRIQSGVSTTLKNVWFDHKGMHSESMQIAELKNFSIHGPGVAAEKDPVVKFPKGHLRINWDKYLELNEFEEVKIEQPVVSVTDETLGEWAGNSANRSTAGNQPVFAFRDIEILHGTLLADSRAALDGMVPKVKGDFSLTNSDVSPSATNSEEEYHLQISNLQLSNHSAVDSVPNGPVPSIFPDSLLPNSEPLKSEEVVKVEKAHIYFTAAGIQRDKRIKKISLEGGILRVGEGLKDVVKKPEGEPQDLPPEASVKSPRARADEREWIDLILNPPDVVETFGQPESSPMPMDTVGNNSFPAVVFPYEGESVQAEAPPLEFLLADAKGEIKRKSLWKIDDLEISKGKVNFDSLIPEMAGLSFGLETKMKDIPLTAEGLLDANKLQAVKIDSLQVRDPYDSFLTVAELPDVFVEFSLAGLAKQEIEKIDLIAPTLNVGESLFRWIDYLRKYRAINEGASVDLRGAHIISPEGTSGGKKSDWLINKIEANMGRLVVAPYGTPITSLPFPFSATTNVAEGKVKLAMNISEDQNVFKIPDYGVELTGLEGAIDFNLPIPEKNNNLVQTFRLKTAKWKKFDLSQLFLTVTFDRYGIYGNFGGETYGGYANGAFNYYLNKNGQWDAWVAGTDLNTGELTKAVVKEGFLMGGKVSTKVFSSGKDATVDAIKRELKSVGDGWFDIALMEKALENLPESWNGLQRGLSEIAINNLRKFDYDHGGGEVYFKDQDGLLKLQFTGAYGTRILNLHLHDWRNQKDKLVKSAEHVQP